MNEPDEGATNEEETNRRKSLRVPKQSIDYSLKPKPKPKPSPNANSPNSNSPSNSKQPKISPVQKKKYQNVQQQQQEPNNQQSVKKKIGRPRKIKIEDEEIINEEEREDEYGSEYEGEGEEEEEVEGEEIIEKKGIKKNNNKRGYEDYNGSINGLKKSKNQNIQTPKSQESKRSRLRVDKEEDSFLVSLRNEVLSYKCKTASQFWLSHEEKLWELFHLEKDIPLIDFRPLTVKSIDYQNETSQVNEETSDLQDKILSSPIEDMTLETISKNQVYVKYRESLKLTPLPVIIPNLDTIEPTTAQLFSTFPTPLNKKRANQNFPSPTSILASSSSLFNSPSNKKRLRTSSIDLSSPIPLDYSPSPSFSKKSKSFISGPMMIPTRPVFVPKISNWKNLSQYLSSFKLFDEDEILITDFEGKALSDATILNRIFELENKGLYIPNPIPKPIEPTQPKTYWNYLLEEVIYASGEMTRNRKLSQNSCRKVARSITKYHDIEKERLSKLQKEEEKRLVKIASGIAKDIRRFWLKIEKVVIMKRENRKKEITSAAMDKHLDFIVGQTEKYSSMLAEKLVNNKITEIDSSEKTQDDEDQKEKEKEKVNGLDRKHSSNSDDQINNMEIKSTSELDNVKSTEMDLDEEFQPTDEPIDDEETIEAEENDKNDQDYENEISTLEKESNLPIEELLKLYNLPPTLLPPQSESKKTSTVNHDQIEKKQQGICQVEIKELKTEESETEKLETPKSQIEVEIEIRPEIETRPEIEIKTDSQNLELNDDDYQQKEEEIDDETTLDLEEKDEEKNEKEIDELMDDANIPIEELLAKYGYINQVNENESEGEGENDSVSEGQKEIDEEQEEEEEEEEKEKDENEKEDENGIEDEQDEPEENEDENDEEVDEQEREELEQLVRDTEKQKEKSQNEKEEEEAAHQAEEELANVADVAKVGMSIQPTGHTLSTTQVKTKVPFLLRGKLREYQLVGLNWLVTMYEKGLNGILADEMGLGKTIQTIGLLAHLAGTEGIWGPHLIVVPTAVMLNWEIELMKWCPSLKILTYYGSLKERKLKRTGWSKNNAFHVCITSYKLVMQDHLMFRRKKWVYLILDEAQHIKNFRSQRWQTLLQFSSDRRLLLTGTPLQNNLMELWSLMHFLMPAVFGSHKDFQHWFSSPIDSMIEGNDKISQSLIQRLHTVLRPFILRRLKKDVEQQMPNKYEHVLYCRLSKRQSYLYDEFMSRSSTKETLASTNVLSILNCLMQLRKVCAHPDLFEVRPIHSPFMTEPLTLNFPSELSLSNSIFSSFPYPRATSSPWNVDLDFLNFRFTSVTPPSHFHSRSTPADIFQDEVVPLSKASVPLLASIPDDHPEYLLLKDQLQLNKNFEHQRYIQFIRTGKDKISPLYSRELISLLTIEPLPCQAALLKKEKPNCSKFFDISIALQEMVLNNIEREGQVQDIIQKFVIVIPPVSTSSPQLLFHRPPIYIKEVENLENEVELNLRSRPDILHSSLTRMATFFPDKRLLQYDCGKLQMLEGLLRKLKPEGHRVLIFSQMTKMLDILEIFLSMHGHKYLRLDGATKIERRQHLIEMFNSDPRYFVFILSTRSGGVGINLTGADTVVFYDSDWNPAMDAQAQDRCHRIGQTRDVHIYRLVTRYTIEENILKKANQKRFLDDVVIQGGSFTTDFLTKQFDWKSLFQERGILNDLVQPVESTSSSSSTTERESNFQNLTQKDFEQALAEVEDDVDVQAMKLAQTEILHELDDFENENPTLETEEGEIENQLESNQSNSLKRRDSVPYQSEESQVSQVREFEAEIESVLGPIEMYALRFVEKYFPEGLNFGINKKMLLRPVDSHQVQINSPQERQEEEIEETMDSLENIENMENIENNESLEIMDINEEEDENLSQESAGSEAEN